MIKWPIQEEDITFINIYAPNIRAPKYIKKILTEIKGEIDSNTIIVRDFNTTLTSMNRSYRQKINKETVALNGTLDKLDLIVIYGTFHPKTAEYTFFTSAHGTFSRTGHMLVHETSLRKFKETEIIWSIISDHFQARSQLQEEKKPQTCGP